MMDVNVFVAGPRALSTLDKNVEERLNNIIKQNITVLVGDANGIDKSMQQYFYRENYRNLLVYDSKGKARNNIGNWPVQTVEVADNIKGFDFYAAKDLKMAENADYGLMLWNGISKGTLNNIINLTKQNKKALIYYTPHKKFYCVNSLDIAKKLAALCGDKASNLFSDLSETDGNLSISDDSEQISLFGNR